MSDIINYTLELCGLTFNKKSGYYLILDNQTKVEREYIKKNRIYQERN